MMDRLRTPRPGKALLALGLVLLSAMLLSATIARAQEVVIAPGEPLIFGASFGLSGEGIASLGEDIQRGLQLAHAAAPSVTIGGVEYAIILDIQDSQCNAEGGVGHRHPLQLGPEHRRRHRPHVLQRLYRRRARL